MVETMDTREEIHLSDPGAILVVDDDAIILDAFIDLLALDNRSVHIARNAIEALDLLTVSSPAMMFMDISMPQVNGLDALKIVKERYPALPVVLMTGFGSSQSAIRAMHSGAYEYLTKPLDGKTVRKLVNDILAAHASDSVGVESPGSVRHEPAGDHDELSGSSSQMQEVFKVIGSISATPNTTAVLILGESGTGKELVARAIHAHSANASEPFVAINCTVLPENLLESELFGHERGAFTGANERQIGKFEYAKGGTIFLDEIGDISADMQKKLLRVLQERQFERLGSHAPIGVRARFITATNRNLEDAIERGNFREDLYYRLKVVTIQLPPLRERRGDIPQLAHYFLEKHSARLGRKLKGFATETMRILESSPFRGNVRELANLIERAVMMTKGDVVLPEALRSDAGSSAPASAGYPIISREFSIARDHVLQQFERQFVITLLTDMRGNVTVAARTSGMTRQNFQRLMKKFNIDSETYRL
jgi:DNA-binding NtrC family response regulator